MRRDIFQAIADPVRRDIIELLANESLTVKEVAERFEISRPAISRHIRILQECGVLKVDQQGRENYYQVQPRELIPAFVWIDQYRGMWEERIDSFEKYLMRLKTKKQSHGKRFK